MNEVLGSLLTELGWSPRALARKINHVFGAGTVAETAPYHWRDGGRTPRPPLPTVTAWVLSRELGRPVTVADSGTVALPVPRSSCPPTSTWA